MRYFLIVFVFFVLSCNSASRKQQTAIDTAKLFDPKQEPDEQGAAEMNMFLNCVALIDPGSFTIRQNDKIYVCENMEELQDSLERNAGEISLKKFYIWTDSNTSFKRIVSVIDILKKVKIDNYKVLNMQLAFTPPEPVEISQPKSVTTRTSDDFTGMVIAVRNNNIQLEYQGKKNSFQNTGELDTFMVTNKDLIDKNEILIRISKVVTAKRLGTVVDVLKKHGITKYYMVTTSE